MKIGVPKGRLESVALEILGLALPQELGRKLSFAHAPGTNEVVRVKQKDVLPLVACGVLTVSVTCTAYWEEWAGHGEGSSGLVMVSVPVSNPWRVSLVGAQSSGEVPINERRVIFTEFVEITKLEFPSALPALVSGSVEGLVADGAFGVTIVSSGATLEANGLQELRVLRTVNPCIVYRTDDGAAEQFVGSLLR